MKVLCVFGTRPEAIKMAPVVKELQKYSAQIETKVCVTSQHREMLDQVLRLFDIRPDYDLDVMQKDQSLVQVTARVLSDLDPVIVKEQPDWLLVQGDTTTTMASSLVAYYRRVKVGHIEAGLRTWNKFHPFPEEINRRITSCTSDLHFAPTETARRNLLREAIDDRYIRVTGNTVIDALHWVAIQSLSEEARVLLRALGLTDSSARVILVTAHRRENFGRPLENICAALKEIARRYDNVHIIYPVHLNPNVQRIVHAQLDNVPRVSLIDPLDYLPLVHLMKHAYLVVTDSGGLQEEAPAFGVPVLVLRQATERPEAIEAGTAQLVGTDTQSIVEAVARLLDHPAEYSKMARATNPFGDGHASERIVKALFEYDQQTPDLAGLLQSRAGF